MNNTWKIYMLTLISFLVGTSQFVISGILDKGQEPLQIGTPAKRDFTTLRKFQNKKPNFSLLMPRNWAFRSPEKRPIVEYHCLNSIRDRHSLVEQVPIKST